MGAGRESLRAPRAFVAAACLWTRTALGSDTPSGELPLESPAHYQADQGCPGEGEFEQLVAKKGTTSLSIENTSIASVRFTLKRNGEQHEGAVVGRSKDGRPIERKVTAGSCQEAAEALAIIWSLVLREEAPRPPQAPPPPQRPAPVQTPPPKKVDEGSRLWLEGRVVAQFNAGRSPENLYSLVSTFGLGFQGRSAFEPLVRLGANVSLPAEHSVGTARATFQLLLGRLELCPLRAPLTSWLSLRVCGLGEGGVLLGRGSGLDVTSSATAKLASAGVSATLEARGSSGFGVEFGGGAHLEFLKSQFELKNTVIYETPQVSAAAFLGLRFDTLR